MENENWKMENGKCFFRRLAILCVVASSVSASAAQFKFGTQTLTVPDGFEVELVAGPPLVNRPINMSLDEQGRLYVTDSAGMSDKAQKQLEAKPHRVVRLDAANNRGHFEKSIVFADKMMFPEGCLWHDGALYVAAPPQIWKLSDTDGDGIADKREVWHDGKTLTGCANDLHGPYLGHDGWFYWCKGAFAEQKYTLPDGKPFVTRAAHIFRARPDGTGIEPVLTGGMDNPVGVAFNSVGERFLSCTFFQNPAGGKRDGLIHAIYGGVYGKVHDVINGHKMTGGVMPVLTNWGAAAPCGIMCYDSAVFGADFRDNLFTCCFNLHKVMRTILVPDGATYTAQDSDFLSSDSTDFHPTDVLDDADGSLLVADTGGWYKVCCPTSQLAKPDVLGAIYRIRKTGAKTIADPRGLQIAWEKMQPEELAKFLGDERHLVRKRAIGELGKRNKVATKALSEVVAKAASVEVRRNAVWALARIDGDDARETVRRAIWDKDYSVAHAAAHVTGLWREVLTNEAHDRPEEWRLDMGLERALMEALGRSQTMSASCPLLVTASTAKRLNFSDTGAPDDASARILEHSNIYALISLDCVGLLHRNLDSNSPQTVRAALVALDQKDGGDLKVGDVLKFLHSDEPCLKATATWIVSHRPEWGGDLAQFYGKKLSEKFAKEDDAAALAAQLVPLVKAPAIQELLSHSALDSEGGAQLVALRVMAAANLKETPAAWLSAVGHALTSSDVNVLTQAVAVARSFPSPKQGDIRFGVELSMLAQNGDLPDSLRLNALAAVAGSAPIDARMFSFLLKNIDVSKPLSDRNAAVSALLKSALSQEQRLLLLDAMKERAGPMEFRGLLPAFERGANDELGAKLLDALKTSKNARGLRAELLKPVFAKFPQAVQVSAADFLAGLNPNAGAQAAHLDELLKKLPAGDVQRGHVILQSAKAACTSCHATGYLGGTLGPDLTSIGKTRTERDLLEAIVYPSASFVRSYEPFVVRTQSGERFTGILKKDAPDEIILAIDPKTEKHIPRAEIEKLDPGTVSLMPEGFEALLTPQELADLIAFLRASK